MISHLQTRHLTSYQRQTPLNRKIWWWLFENPNRWLTQVSGLRWWSTTAQWELIRWLWRSVKLPTTWRKLRWDADPRRSNPDYLREFSVCVSCKSASSPNPQDACWSLAQNISVVHHGDMYIPHIAQIINSVDYMRGAKDFDYNRVAFDRVVEYLSGEVAQHGVPSVGSDESGGFIKFLDTGDVIRLSWVLWTLFRIFTVRQREESRHHRVQESWMAEIDGQKMQRRLTTMCNSESAGATGKAYNMQVFPHTRQGTQRIPHTKETHNSTE